MLQRAWLLVGVSSLHLAGDRIADLGSLSQCYCVPQQLVSSFGGMVYLYIKYNQIKTVGCLTQAESNTESYYWSFLYYFQPTFSCNLVS